MNKNKQEIYINLNNGLFEPFHQLVNHDHPTKSIDFNFTSMLFINYNITKRSIISLCEAHNLNYDIKKYGKEYDIVFYNLKDAIYICNFLNDFVIYSHGLCGLDNYTMSSLIRAIELKAKKLEERLKNDKE